ncbi:flagellar protein FlaG [Gallaecimonas pentaromativorans]|uniref:Flagellar protein FlaG n=1 Tax=Gallaecimonas pentaromativorans TaxID=584787 RepID=A0A3N1P4M7_9GAMM|nr:flagellar protein FlaG [Gallaecimonas pentaromativorans]MED5526709.1 flagellar protein FlaG [Pseudomonadota bacterium]ROQ22608.1 flagellar protein FlaG [Gallaecimonas pentaromativorans]
MSDVSTMLSNSLGDTASGSLPAISSKTSATPSFDTPVTQPVSGKEDTPADTRQSLSDAVQVLAEFVNLRGHNLNFSTDESSGRTVVKVLDAQTGDVIRQIPSEEVLKTADRVRQLREELGAKIGIFLDSNV